MEKSRVLGIISPSALLSPKAQTSTKKSTERRDRAEADAQTRAKAREIDAMIKARSKSGLTNAEHHAMQRDHSFIADKISELPHHYFSIAH